MKNLFKFPLYAAVAFGIALTSCSDDDSNTTDPSGGIINDQNEIVKDINEDVTLMAGETYFINKGIHVTGDAKLTIEKGVTVRNGESAYLLVETGSQIFINGEAGEEVVFTVNTQTPEPGAWGGLIINGKAPINVSGGSAIAEVGDVAYGGDNASDNSGKLSYAVFKYGGHQINSEKEHNGLTFNGVGNGTSVDHIAVYNAADDAYEWFGGTVNASNLYAYGTQDDIYDWTYGWVGTATNVYGEHNAAINNGENDRGIEADTNSSNFAATPFSNPTVENITLKDADQVGTSGLKLRAGTSFNFENLVIEGFGGSGKSIIEVETEETVGHIINGDASIASWKFMPVAGQGDYTLKVKDASENEVAVIETFFSDAVDAAATGAPEALVTWGKSVAIADNLPEN
ncbi:hypothetical protein [Persicobacter sp. CCB-QB2]|uniref:hypothetical protein n=1 Tax=Persicobacter sp. CCB-QB2 TaxID=1561025 RepID=UPI0006A9B875|nr:hypothetical protein [Persicobacter sp. CCB-QB2]